MRVRGVRAMRTWPRMLSARAAELAAWGAWALVTPPVDATLVTPAGAAWVRGTGWTAGAFAAGAACARAARAWAAAGGRGAPAIGAGADPGSVVWGRSPPLGAAWPAGVVFLAAGRPSVEWLSGASPRAPRKPVRASVTCSFLCRPCARDGSSRRSVTCCEPRDERSRARVLASRRRTPETSGAGPIHVHVGAAKGLASSVDSRSTSARTPANGPPIGTDGVAPGRSVSGRVLGLVRWRDSIGSPQSNGSANRARAPRSEASRRPAERIPLPGGRFLRRGDGLPGQPSSSRISQRPSG